jgi:LmbE family N-acetylglucosaminyl deacetylase
LGLPEARLKKNIPSLTESLKKIIYEINPDIVFMPFRYDRHPDHLAVNQTLTRAIDEGWYKGKLFEYFIYYRSRLLPARDIRKYIKPQYLLEIDIKNVSSEKRRALDCYKTQTTIYYSWQTRPILTPLLLDEECLNPEIFLMYDQSQLGASVLSKFSLWIRLTNWFEPFLRKWKYLISTVIKRSYQKVLHFGR